MVSFSSPPPSPLLSQSPRSPSRHIPLRLPDVANLIVKLRRANNKAQAKQYPIESSSGEPQTHPTLISQDATLPRRVPLVEERRFLCRDGVDVKKLLRTMRASLLEEAQMIGANVLVDERYVCLHITACDVGLLTIVGTSDGQVTFTSRDVTASSKSMYESPFSNISAFGECLTVPP